MPYLEVRLNDKKISVGGGPEIDLLVLTLIASKAGPAPQLSLNGMQKIKGDKSEHIEWIRQEVKSKDRIRIVSLETAVSGTPISKSTAPIKPLEEIAKTQQSETDVGRVSDVPFTGFRPTFEITMPNSSHLRADIGEEETLQLVLTWNIQNNECKFDVDSLTVMEDGYTKGRHWVDGKLKSKEWMEIKVISEYLP